MGEISKMLRLVAISAAVTWWCKSTSFVSYPTTGRGAHTQVYLGHGYQERMSPSAHDPGYAEPDTKGAKPFTAAEATGATAEVKSGWVVKTINGADVAGQSFAKIMDILDDEVMDQRMSQHFYASQKEPREGEPADTPITVGYQEGAGADVQWPEMKEDIWEGFTR